MNIIKKAFLGFAAMALAVMPLATQAAQDVRIESEVTVANVTNGAAPNYKKSATLKEDDIVRVQVWFHNMEDAHSNKNAQNLRVKIDVPSSPGKSQTVKSKVSADNSNTVNDTASLTLPTDNATLKFIPGTVKLRHNVAANTDLPTNYVTSSISDSVVTGANGAEVEDVYKPCFKYEATVTAEFRVTVPSVSIVKKVRVSGQKDYVIENSAKAGDTLDYVLIVKNEGNSVLKKVVVGDNMPPYMTYVAGSTKLVNSNTSTSGKSMPDGITTGGITIDDMNPGSTQYVYFKMKVNADITCANHRLKNVGIVRPQGFNEIFNVAFTNVNCIPPKGGGDLPETGPEGAMAGLAGMGTMGYVARAYARSRRSLKDALLSK